MSKAIENIDKNFKSKSADEQDIVYRNVMDRPFKLTGFPWIQQEKVFCRVPQNWLARFNENIQHLAWHTSGGMVRFVTSSPFVAIKVELMSEVDMPHMTRAANSGFDFYVGKKYEQRFIGAAFPQNNCVNYNSVVYYKGEFEQLWTINFPLYNGIKELYIGVAPNSTIKEAPELTVPEPIVFYGSSITQGSSASRPGNAYTHHIARLLDANIINLGFSGNARGETEMAQLISTLSMSALVMDYDHNAPNAEHLEKTHEQFFKIIRKEHPYIPVIFISRPDFDYNPSDNDIRRKIIYKTYSNAKKSGDKNVFYIDGQKLFGTKLRDACTIDTCHPNDLGFFRIAEVIYPIIKRALHCNW